MRILMLGGTGFIGSRVVHALSGHDVWIFHRGRTGRDLPGVRYVHGDRGNLPRHRTALRELRPDVVVDMMPQNAGDARAVVDCFAGAIDRLVAISSGSVYRTFGVMMGMEEGPVDNTPCAEDAPLRSRLFPYRGAMPRPPGDPKRWLDDYDKIPVEQAYLGCSSLGCSVVRLPMVYGPGDPDRRLGSYVQRMLDGRSAILLHDAAARWRNSRAFVTNAANAIASVVRSGARGRVYNVADPLDMEEADLILAIGQVLRWTGAVHVVPPDWSWQARPAIDEFPIQTRFAQHLRIDSSRLRQELGYEESVSFEAGLECTVRELASSPVEIDYAEEDRLLAAQARGVSPVSGRTDEPAGG